VNTTSLICTESAPNPIFLKNKIKHTIFDILLHMKKRIKYFFKEKKDRISYSFRYTKNRIGYLFRYTKTRISESFSEYQKKRIKAILGELFFYFYWFVIFYIGFAYPELIHMVLSKFH
jgi:pilus assembly protein TadC